MKNVPTIALHGNYFDNNFGDLLLFKVFEQWVRSAQICKIVYPMVPEAESTRFRTHFQDAVHNTKSYSSWDALIYSGGGLFADSGSGSRFLLGHFDKRFFKENVLPAEISIWRRNPYAIIGLEVGPLSNVFVRKQAKRIFKNANKISVRDLESQNYVNSQFGIREEIACAPDPAVTISKEDIPAEAKQKICAILGPHGDRILLGIHHPRDFLLGNVPSESLREGLISVLGSSAEVLPVLFTDIGDSQYSIHCEKLAEVIKTSVGKECIKIPFPGVWETVELISRLSAVLTTKLHVGVVAYAMGVYCESFANHPKTMRFYKLTERSAQCTLFKDTDKKVALEKITRALEIARRKPVLTDITWERIRKEAHLHKTVALSFLDSVLHKA